ncbi:MAG: hypothetical protein AAF810_12015, partial [Cyanobacteria bacterium P01_D01_bin.36]
MGNQLGHGAPLGALHSLGSQVQRRALGNAPLSILNLKAFYPNGFPSIAAGEGTTATSKHDASIQRKSDAERRHLDAVKIANGITPPSSTAAVQRKSVESLPGTASSQTASSAQNLSSTTSLASTPSIQRRSIATPQSPELSAKHSVPEALSGVEYSLQGKLTKAKKPAKTKEQTETERPTETTKNSESFVQRQRPKTPEIRSSAESAVQHQFVQRQVDNNLSQTASPTQNEGIANSSNTSIQRQSDTSAGHNHSSREDSFVQRQPESVDVQSDRTNSTSAKTASADISSAVRSQIATPPSAPASPI